MGRSRILRGGRAAAKESSGPTPRDAAKMVALGFHRVDPSPFLGAGADNLAVGLLCAGALRHNENRAGTIHNGGNFCQLEGLEI